MTLANSYLDRDEFKARTIAPASLVDGMHLPHGPDRTSWVTFVESRLVIATGEINARLRKRYAVPFSAPVSETVLGWLADLVTPYLYRRRGIDSADEQMQSLDEAAERAREQMKEAADSDVGLYDLPPLNTSTGEGITKGGPFAYSETSPYSWMDVQSETLRGGGT